MKNINAKSTLFASVATTLVALSGNVSADALALYGASINKSSQACVTFGDMVSCSAPMLNYLSNLNQSTTVENGGYVLSTPQGELKQYIVVAAGGDAALFNGDTSPVAPTGSQVEDGFKTNRGGDNFLATGKSDGTTLSGGNMADPSNNNLLLAGADNPGTWDVSTTWLRNALTINGARRELMIGFDYNQAQAAETSVDYWGLITVRDVDGNKADKIFEIARYSGQSYLDFTSTKSFVSQPSAADFQAVSGTICVYAIAGVVSNPAGSCPAGTVATGALLETIDNSQATNSTEFLGFLPELNDNLESYIGEGYDTISVRLMFGCFGGTDRKNGQGYLSSGETTNCDGGGFGDVFLMAGDVMETRVPEPASVLLVALGLLGAGIQRWRKV